MRKICLLFSIILCCLSGFAQEFTVSPSTVESGAAVTVTGTGETSGAYFCSVQWDPTLITYSDGTPRSWITTKPFSDISFKDVFGTKPTSFKMIITNSHTLEDFTVTLGIRTNICSTTPGTPTQTNVIKYITVTVKHTQTSTTAYNDAQSKVFYKNDCSPGFSSDPYTYSVAANKYSAPTKAEANNKALAEINTNGQNTANATLTCKQVYYNTEVTGSFTRNNCGLYTSTEPVSYTVPANQFKGFSQADADAKANSELAVKGQANANNIGVCTPVRYIEGPDSMYMLADSYFSVVNKSPGDSFKWIFPASRFTIRGGINGDTLYFTVKRGGGTNDYTFPLKVEVTKSNGQVITLTKDVTILYCLNCPL